MNGELEEEEEEEEEEEKVGANPRLPLSSYTRGLSVLAAGGGEVENSGESPMADPPPPLCLRAGEVVVVLFEEELKVDEEVMAPGSARVGSLA